MAKRIKPSEKFIDMLLELTGYSWKFGVVVSVIFLVLSSYAYRWAYAYNHPVDKDVIANAFIGSIGWLVYLIPIMLLGLSIIFAFRAFATYSKQSRW